MISMLKRRLLWLRPKDEDDRNRNYVIGTAQSCNVAGNLMGGSIFTGLLIYLQADNGLLGLFAIAGALINLCQFFSPLVLERFPRRKSLLIKIRIFSGIVNLFIIGAIPFLPFAVDQKTQLLFIAVIGLGFINSLVAPGYSAWHINLIPEEKRVDYFSIVQLVGTILIPTIMLGATKLLDIYRAAGQDLLGFTILRAIAGIFIVLDIYCLIRLPEKPVPPVHAVGFKKMFLAPIFNKPFMLCILICSLWGFCAGLPGPYFLAYQLQELKMDYSYIFLLGFISMPLSLLFTPLWRKVIAYKSWRLPCIIIFVFQAFTFTMFGLTSQDRLFLYPIAVIIAGCFTPASNIVIGMLPFTYLPEQNQSGFLGFYTTVLTLAGLLSATVGRNFMLATENSVFTLGGLSLQNTQALMLGGALLYLLSLLVVILVLPRLKERG